MRIKRNIGGSITVFMTIFFLLFFSLFCVIFENARMLSVKGYMSVAAESAAVTAFGNYNKELYEDYGLFAYGGYDGIYLSELAEEFETILQENLKVIPDKTMKNPAQSYMSFYRIGDIHVDAIAEQFLTDEDVFFRQIEEERKSSLVKNVSGKDVGQVSDQDDISFIKNKLETTKEYEDGKYDSEKQESEDEEEIKSDKKDMAGGNPLEIYTDMMRDGILRMVCDETKLSEISIPERNQKKTGDDTGDINVKDSAADILDQYVNEAEHSEGTGNAGKRKISLISYAFDHFSSYETDYHRAYQYGIEYLIAGKEEEKNNLLAIVNRLLAIRMVVNFMYIISDSLLQEKSMATATAIAGITGLPPVISAVQYTILLILAFEEACVDITALLGGRNIPLLKNAGNFKMKYEEICMASKQLFQRKAREYNTENSKAGITMSYQQYLWGMLLATPEERLQERSCDLIQYDLRERYNQSFCMEDCIGTAVYRIQYKVPFVFGNLPFLSSTTWMKKAVLREQEVSYGYENK